MLRYRTRGHKRYVLLSGLLLTAALALSQATYSAGDPSQWGQQLAGATVAGDPSQWGQQLALAGDDEDNDA